MKRIFTIIFLFTAISGGIQAQDLESAYFLNGYSNGHEMNPAKDYDRKGYVSMPVLGNIGVGLYGNTSLTSIFVKDPVSGGLTTILNPDISMKDAMAGLSKSNRSTVDLRVDVLGFGFHKWGGFNTFNLSLRSSTTAIAPYDLFSALKQLQNQDYDISGLAANSTTWVEIGFGHSRNVGKAWRIGGKLKALIGGARANLTMENAHINTLGDSRWIITSDAKMEVSMSNFTWGETKTSYDIQGREYQKIDFANMNLNRFSPNGGGLAADLGAEWDMGKQGILKGMTLSMSVLDIGFIRWAHNMKAENVGHEVIYSGFNNVPFLHGNGETAEEQSNRYGDLFNDLASLEDKGSDSRTTALGATVNVGAQYRMPFYDKLSATFLSTTRINGSYSWNEERLGATISPLKWLEGAVNVGFGTLGTSFGWVVNIHPRGFNLSLGMDHTMGSLSKQGIPLKRSTSLQLGICFPFGKVIEK